MPIQTAEKTKGKQRIMRAVEPAVLQLGFTKHGSREFTLTGPDGSEWRLLFNIPTFAPLFRIFPSFTRSGAKPISGPYTEAYAAPNTPNGTRYNFAFHLAPETHERCADNLIRWLHDVAMPWFRSSPTTDWRNPKLIN